VARIERAQVLGFVGPAERRERPERRREPRVEDIGRPRQLARAALRARIWLRLLDDDVPIRALPQRQLVAPPDLARDVPVRRVLERLDREAVLRLRVVDDAAGAQSLDRRLLQGGHRAPPLQRDQRLDPGFAALTEGDRVAIVLALLEQNALA